MLAITLLVTFAIGQVQAEKDVTDAEKKAFLKELAKLPTKGEFFTEEAIKKAAPSVRVLLALTEKDLENYDLYPFLALSSGLMEHKEPRQYGATHFAKIAHPEIKLAWAIGLFDEEKPSAEVVLFLRKSLDSEQGARLLSAMLGFAFEDFKERVIKTDESGKRTKVELVKKHVTNAFPDYREAFSYTNEQYTFAPSQLAYAVRPFKQQGELYEYNLANGKSRHLVIPQPEGFKADREFGTYFDNPTLSINSRGDLFCRWTIEGNGDHGLALLKKGSDSFLVKRVKLYLAHCLVLADSDGTWYLVQGDPHFTVYQADRELNLTRLGDFPGKGHHSTRIVDARFISKDVLHLFWGDVLPRGNHLRMRCIDFDVKQKKSCTIERSSSSISSLVQRMNRRSSSSKMDLSTMCGGSTKARRREKQPACTIKPRRMEKA
jgi:hypothetical protein